MKVVIQRVLKASVAIDKIEVASIQKGMLVLVGIENQDSTEDSLWLSKKIANLRIFADDTNAMNKSILDSGGNIIVVSQFTLQASTKKGSRPSFLKAAKPEIAIVVYHEFIGILEKEVGKKIQTGKFGADMQVSLINDGPVTILIDSKNKI